MSVFAQMSMSCALPLTPPAVDVRMPSMGGTSAILTGSLSFVILYGRAVKPAEILEPMTVVFYICSGSSTRVCHAVLQEACVTLSIISPINACTQLWCSHLERGGDTGDR